MAVYVEKLKGYIADNPNIEFERCDGKVFSYDEVNTASMNDQSESLTINGGQSNFPLAIIDTSRTLEFTFDSSAFSLDMFAMANASNIKEGDAACDTLESKLFEVKSNKAEIPYVVTAGSVKINGFELDTADTPSVEGKISVKIEASKATVTFHDGDLADGDTIRIAYRRVIGEKASIVSVTTKSTTAKGALYAHWPVYSSGTDCTEAAIKGWVHLFIPRVRVTALPGFDNSYKSASTHGVTFTALDPKRADEKMFDLSYEAVAA